MEKFSEIWRVVNLEAMKTISILLPLFFTAFFTTPSRAQAGSPDSTFNSDGVVVFYQPEGTTAARAVLVQPDGKILVAGMDGNAPARDILLLRYRSNGELDSKFGENGVVLTDIGGGSDDVATAMAIQPDDKIVVAGSSGDSLVVLRYLGSNASPPGYGVETPYIRFYPNPVGRQFYLDFGFPEKNTLSVSLLDLLGRIVYVFKNNEKRSPGKFREILTLPDNVLPGTYVLHLRADGFEAKEKVVIVR
ncbi:MAG: T9SS type A sorting domain-containing protein [Saprospiraceae bacterium]